MKYLWVFYFSFFILSIKVSDILCDDGPTASCDDSDWLLANEKCYYWDVGEQVTFDQAHDECHSRGAELLTIGSSAELNWVNVQTEFYSTSGWWIGLTKQENKWRWLDGSTASNINWNVEPDNMDTQDCCNVNQYKKFSDDFCFNKYPYICKFSKREEEYCPTESDDERWAYLTYACYWIADPADPREYLTWPDAVSKCQSLNPLKRGGMHLLSITSGIESDFFSTELPYRSSGVSTPWWTGLNDKSREDFYEWEDGQVWNASLTPWDNAPSNGSDELCAIMYTSGVVDDYKCSGRSHYVCQKSAVEENIQLGCPTHWLRGGHSCYLIANHSKATWSAARQTCQNGGGDLLKVDLVSEKYWLDRLMLGSGGFWTGLNDQDTEGDYKWADGSKLDPKLIQWDQEPNNDISTEHCASVNRAGGFSDLNCLDRQGYICEYVNDPGAPCIKDWITDGGSGCYFFSSTNRTDLMIWTEVQQVCLDQAHIVDSDLQAGYLCLDSHDEVSFVTSQLGRMPVTAYGWWTGLNDKTVPGVWVWQRDYDMIPEADFIKWNKEPNNFNNEDCTVMMQGGRYNDIDCGALSSFICEQPASGASTLHSWFYTFIFTIVAMVTTSG